MLVPLLALGCGKANFVQAKVCLFFFVFLFLSLCIVLCVFARVHVDTQSTDDAGLPAMIELFV